MIDGMLVLGVEKRIGSFGILTLLFFLYIGSTFLCLDKKGRKGECSLR